MKDVQILTNDQVLKLLSVEECIPVIENLFCCLEKCQMPPKMYLDIPNGDFRAMPAIVNNTAGIKWCGVHLDETGLKRRCNIFAKIIINDVNTGEMLLMMDAEKLTAIRTAAVTGVATKYISRPDASVAAFVGCGNQTLYQVQAVLAVRDIQEIRLFDLNLNAAEKLRHSLDVDCTIKIYDSLELCLKEADIVTTLTPSRHGFVEYESLKSSVHINAVGADAQGKRELCQSVLDNVDFVIYDNWEQCSHSGEIQYVPIEQKKQRWSSLGDVVSGLVHIEGDQTLFDATGLAIEDVATARYIYEKVK